STVPPVPAGVEMGATGPILPAPATTADGRFAISSKGNTIKVWDLRTGQAVHTFQGQPGSGASGASLVPGLSASAALSPLVGTTAPGERALRPAPAKRGGR